MITFDQYERQAWAGQAGAFAAGFAKLCAYSVPQLLDGAGVGEGTRVLDIGTGTGTVAAAACARGARVTAVDAEPSMVELAALNVPAARVQLGLLPDLPFADGEFEAITGNFVLNHVGQPARALAELRRLLRPGGRLALTIWPNPPAPGQALLGRAVEAVGLTRPAHLPPVAAEDDFPRTAEGLTELLTTAGLNEVHCESLHWDHRTTPDEWWTGPAAGVAYIGQLLLSQPESTRTEVRQHFDRLAEEFRTPNGDLLLPHTALLATAIR
ncbi:SAM-dependent methyltransferase [Streptomyces tateyamensis]|uniref:SAM-dependent methyltransferase n=1 Tax=Streptomyces tateyamensis TaxID=565073 RepID=A0A2V4NGM3_9ACTN|nr:SAM-dependent methyltransferase [Streptomyces tateyamensis]